MKQIHKALLLAAAMIGVALLAVVELVPQDVAQFAPFALLAMFPGAWLTRNRCSRNPFVRGQA